MCEKSAAMLDGKISEDVDIFTRRCEEGVLGKKAWVTEIYVYNLIHSRHVFTT